MISLITLNCNGLRDLRKRSAFYSWLANSSIDVVCLQETHASSEAEITNWFPSFSTVSSPGSVKSRGVAILFRPSKFKLLQSRRDDLGRPVEVDLAFPSGSVVRVVTIYAPNRNPERNTFLEDVASSLDSSVFTILTCDFNAVFDPSVDRRGAGTLSAGRESRGAVHLTVVLKQTKTAAGLLSTVLHIETRDSLN